MYMIQHERVPKPWSAQTDSDRYKSAQTHTLHTYIYTYIYIYILDPQAEGAHVNPEAEGAHVNPEAEGAQTENVFLK